MKVIVGHFYGPATPLECEGEFQYDNGYIVQYPGANDRNPYNPYIWIADDNRIWARSFYYHNLPPFIYYAIRKWRRCKVSTKCETYRLTSGYITNFDTVEETVSKFLEWAKTTHTFLQSSSEELFTEFFTDLGKSSILGEAYVKACKALYERFEEDYKSEGNYYSGNTAYRLKIEGFNDIKPEDIISDNSSYYSKYNNDIQNELGSKVKELDLAQESLMIKLTYEKDLDTVREMLAEYDIVI